MTAAVKSLGTSYAHSGDWVV